MFILLTFGKFANDLSYCNSNFNDNWREDLT